MKSVFPEEMAKKLLTIVSSTYLEREISQRGLGLKKSFRPGFSTAK